MTAPIEPPGRWHFASHRMSTLAVVKKEKTQCRWQLAAVFAKNTMWRSRSESEEKLADLPHDGMDGQDRTHGNHHLLARQKSTATREVLAG